MIDFDVFQMSEYGVCQNRKRLIAGSPHLLRNLRDQRDLTLRLRVADVCVNRPADAIGVMTNSTSVGGKEKTQRMRKAFSALQRRRLPERRVKPGGLTGPAPCIISRGHIVWVGKEAKVLGTLDTRTLAVLQTFSRDYVWPKRCKQARKLIGGAIPPHFAKQMMRGYHVV